MNKMKRKKFKKVFVFFGTKWFGNHNWIENTGHLEDEYIRISDQNEAIVIRADEFEEFKKRINSIKIKIITEVR